MTLLEQVKPRMGVFYSTPEKDAEVQGMIDAAIGYFQGAGWAVGPAPSPIAVEAVALFCKMAQSTDPGAMTNHPVLLSFIAQGRLEPKEVTADEI